MGPTRHDTRYLRAVPYRSSASPCPLLLSIPAQTPGSSSLIGFPASPCPSGAFLPCSPAHNPWAFLGLCASPASPGPIQTSVPSLCPFGLSTPPSPGSSSVLGFHASACPSSISSANVLPDKPWDFPRLCGSLPPLLLTHPGYPVGYRCPPWRALLVSPASPHRTLPHMGFPTGPALP